MYIGFIVLMTLGFFIPLIYGRTVLEWYDSRKDAVSEWFSEDEDDGEILYSCNYCNRGGMKRWEDKVEHEEAQHKSSNEEKSKDGNNRSGYESEPSSVRGDLVDDYEIDWDIEDEDDDIQIQEATGSGKSGKLQKLMRYYNRVIDVINRDGRIVIRRDTHVGSARGFDVKKNFVKAVKRHPDDELKNYDFVRDKKGSYPVIIERD